MRRILFCHCGFVNKVGEDYYVCSSYSDEVMARYFLLGDEVELVAEQGRPKDCVQSQRHSKSTLEHMTITPVPKVGRARELINIGKRRRIVEEAVKRSDIVVARLPSGAGFLAVKYAKKYRKPYMIEVVGCVWDAMFNYNWKGKCLAWFERERMKRVVYDAPYAIYVSNSFLQKRYPCKGNTVAISNVVLEKCNESAVDERKLKIQRKSNSDKFILGTVGDVDVAYKGQRLVMEALKELNKRGVSNIEYQLVGSGDPSSLQQVAKSLNVEDQVRFVGTVPHSKMIDWFKSVDCYIQPSYTEGLCRAVIEAMSCAMPCIVSNVGGNPELIGADFCFDQKICLRKKTARIADLIVKTTDSKICLMQSERNYEESLKYNFDILSRRRAKFYREFVENNFK